LALAASASGVPFVVVAPTSSVDPAVADGGKIPLEERAASEVTSILGTHPIAPAGTQAINPAFDVTPASLITAIVTERGVARAPFGPALRAMLGGPAVRAASRGARAKPKVKPKAKVAEKKPARSAKAAPKKTAAAKRARPKRVQPKRVQPKRAHGAKRTARPARGARRR